MIDSIKVNLQSLTNKSRKNLTNIKKKKEIKVKKCILKFLPHFKLL
jgi:hypothetical protein